jgi:hypothetical protein
MLADLIALIFSIFLSTIVYLPLRILKDLMHIKQVSISESITCLKVDWVSKRNIQHATKNFWKKFT